MNKNNLILYCLIIGLSFSSDGAFRYGSSAREVALAGSMVSISNKGFNSFTNPAFIANTKESEWGISYFVMSLDRSIQAMSYSKHVPPGAGISLSFLRVGIDDIKLTDWNNNELARYNHWEGYGTMSFALNLSKKIAFGTNLKLYINELKKADLSDYPARGLGLDIGLQYKANDKLNFGFFSQNLFAKYKWGTKSNKIQQEIPVITKFGFLYRFNQDFDLLAQFDFDEEGYDRFRIGAEHYLMEGNNPFIIRWGIKESNNKEVDFLYYLGFGLEFGIFQNKSVKLDYALDPGLMGEGMSHIFSFSM